MEVVVSDGSDLDPPFLSIAVTPDGEAVISAQSLILRGDKGVQIEGGVVTLKGKVVLSESDPL